MMEDRKLFQFIKMTFLTLGNKLFSLGLQEQTTVGKTEIQKPLPHPVSNSPPFFSLSSLPYMYYSTYILFDFTKPLFIYPSPPFTYPGPPFTYSGHPFTYPEHPFTYSRPPFTYPSWPFFNPGQPFIYPRPQLTYLALY